MTDPRLYESDIYVVLEPSQPEQFLSATEVVEKLRSILLTRQDNLPRDVQRFADVDEQARYLLESSCELDLEPGLALQWYMVRLEK